MKKTTLLLLGILLCLTSAATRPLRHAFLVQQPDGTSLLVQKEGGASFGFFATSDGLALLRNADGALCYAVSLPDGTDLACSGILAHEISARTATERDYISQNVCSRAEAYVLMREKLAQLPETSPFRTPSVRAATTADGLLPLGTDAGGTVSSQGAPVIPVIKVAFADVAFDEASTMDKISRWLNEDNYSDESLARGSVAQYFREQSEGRFAPRFDVVHEMTASQPRSYYGANKGTSRDQNVRALVQEAINSAVDAGVDFSTFNVGTSVPLVAVLFAGPGESDSFEDGSDDYIWPHFLKGITLTAGTTTVRSYFVGAEIMQSYGTNANDITGAQFEGIGTFCHEFGHALGLPDFYYTGSDTEIYNSLHTMEYWSVMDYGQYTYNSYRPICYTAFEKASLGWLEITELVDAGVYTLAALHDTTATAPRAYLIRSDADENEYYLLENRQVSAWHPSLLGHGMLVTHVDYQSSTWSGNRVNNTPSRQGYEVVPADNEKSGYGTFTATLRDNYQADLFPGTTNATELTDTTIPATSLHSGGMLGKGIFHITEERDGSITFSFLDPTTQVQTAEAQIEAQAGACYDLAGRRILSPTKGVYIQGGRKVVRR